MSEDWNLPPLKGLDDLTPEKVDEMFSGADPDRVREICAELRRQAVEVRSDQALISTILNGAKALLGLLA